MKLNDFRKIISEKFEIFVERISVCNDTISLKNWWSMANTVFSDTHDVIDLVAWQISIYIDVNDVIETSFAKVLSTAVGNSIVAMVIPYSCYG